MRSKKVMKTLTTFLPYVLLAVAVYFVFNMYLKEGFDVSGDNLLVSMDTGLAADASGVLATAVAAAAAAQTAYDTAKKTNDDAVKNAPALKKAVNDTNNALTKANAAKKKAVTDNSGALTTLGAAKEQLDYDSMTLPYNTSQYTASRTLWNSSASGHPHNGSQATYDAHTNTLTLDSEKYTYYMAGASYAKSAPTGGWHSRSYFTANAKAWLPPKTPKPADAVDWHKGVWLSVKPKVSVTGHTVANCVAGTEPNIAKTSCVLSCPNGGAGTPTATGTVAYGSVDYCTY